ncbi:amine oxidase [Ruegeria profundi]|uniref:Amine oxidase n=2 Tax=Ruegeria profundi TaxID=1685378 RepID=A0A0X3TZY5_9RHOB|nr:NAD(P)/FAD-dependent oxidoreductase [Ruegeria profundi]KUJ81363.1 amine oxidase [Ruegeria profundi]
MQTDVLIIGGGLSGLSLADQLNRADVDFHVVEARDRLGGRILTKTTVKGSYDLGPAWFWHGQPRIAALIDRFGLKRFEQHYKGALSFEDEAGRVERGRGFASMQGSWRLEGGLQNLVQALAATLPEARVSLDAALVELFEEDTGLKATFADGSAIHAKQVVLALPPRVVAETVRFYPALPEPTHLAMSNVATWMAGQAKAVAIYETPFWRAEGLSGDAMSRFGPMVEIHDASPADGRSGALFGFIGVPPSARQDLGALRQQILIQLARLFGPEAAEPAQLLIKDWAFDPFAATPEDQKPLFAHPGYGMPDAMTDLMDGRVIFAGTETAQHFGGYLEGALEAAENALDRLQALNAIEPAG